MNKVSINKNFYLYLLCHLLCAFFIEGCSGKLGDISAFISQTLPNSTSPSSTPNTSTNANTISLFTENLVRGEYSNSSVNSFNSPIGIAINPATGNIYVAESQNQLIRKITPGGIVSTLAGATTNGFLDGVGAAARFYGPQGLACDSNGNIYVADTSNSAIRKITPAGSVSTLATGLLGPKWIAVDAYNNVFVADTDSCCNSFVKKITPAGVVTTYVSLGASIPAGIAVDNAMNVYVADPGNQEILLISNIGTPSAPVPGASTVIPLGGVVPFGITTDTSGNLYAAIPFDNKILKITGGSISPFAGSISVYAGSGFIGSADASAGNATSATFNSPIGVMADSSGNVYVTDTTNNIVRKITSSLAVTTIAGTALRVGASDNTGERSQDGSFGHINDVVRDSIGNIYVADSDNHIIRKITPAGEFKTFAGQVGKPSFVDGLGGAAGFNYPTGLALDSAGNLYIADKSNNAIRSITPSGFVTTIPSGALSGPTSLVFDSLGNLFVLDSFNDRVQKIGPGPTYNVSTFAGGFNSANGMTIDSSDNLYIADTNNGKIVQVTSGAVSSDYAVGFASPMGVTIDNSGNLYVTSNGRLINKVALGGAPVTTLAGQVTTGWVDDVGAAAKFSSPTGIKYASDGYLYVADKNNFAIRKIDPVSAKVTTPLGTPRLIGTTDTIYPASTFLDQGSIVKGGDGSIYVADTYNHRILKVAPDGKSFIVLAGSGTEGQADGSGTSASFRYPQGIAIDASGTLYVADTFNHTIRQITPSGVVSTFAGTNTINDFQDGTGSTARFSYPQGIIIDSSGQNLYVADSYNHRVRNITISGAVVTTLFGNGNSGYEDGPISTAKLGYLKNLTLDLASHNIMYVMDSGNNVIRKITNFLSSNATVETLMTFTLQAHSNTFNSNTKFLGTAMGMDKNGNIYLTDYINKIIKKINTNSSGTASRLGTTIAGTAGTAAFATGPLPGTLLGPTSIFVDVTSTGTFLYILENNNLMKINLLSE